MNILIMLMNSHLLVIMCYCTGAHEILGLILCRYSKASDVFSFGVFLYELVARCAPWRGKNNNQVV